MADSTPKVPGFWANIGSLFGSYAPAQTVLPEPYESWTATGGIPVMDPGTPLELLTRKSAVEEIWRTQPHVRTVVDFIASNLATVPLQVFDRMGDTERRRVSASDDGTGLAEVLKTPVPGRQGSFRFWHAVVSDWLLYDFWLVVPLWAKDGGGLEGLQHIPSWRISLTTDFLNRPIRAKVYVGDKAGPGDPTELELDLSKCVFDHGYAPNAAGCTPMEALRETMAEQKEALAFRKRSFRNGLRGGGYIRRPTDAKQWTETARARFESAMRKYRTDGKDAGGLPLLEDGMTIESNPIGSLRDAQDLAARELSSVEVANLYHIPPELLGMRPGNYANVDAYRQALYRDHLGPYITAWEQAVGVQLLDQVEKFTGREFPDRYVEANLDTKLRGSFEQRAAQMQLASGGPWRTLNEVRALDNLPPVDNGDEVLRPLNMGQATQGTLDSGPVAGVAPTEDAPADEPPAPEAEPKAAAHACTKADGPDALDEDEKQVLETLAHHFARQSKAVASAIGAGGDWWDAERWDKELAADLLKMAADMSTSAALEALADNGLDADLYDVARTLNWLTKASALNAQAINAATYAAIADGDEDLELSERADKAFTYATEKRAADAAPTLVSFAKGFGVVESARQAAGDRATKTWSTTSSRPRASHAKLNGKTVGIDETFPNGLKWPGTTANGGKSYDETANCRCRVTVHIPDKED